MKLQLALDLIDLEGVRALLADLADLVDIIEIGTPLIIREGVKAVAEIRRTYPEHTVLADLKIMDAGEHEARIAFEAGADIVTVLGAAHSATILGTVDQARSCGRQVMSDLIATRDIAGRAGEIDAMGVDYICVHTAFDVQAQGPDPLEELRLVRPVLRHAGIAVAGGVKPDTMADIASHHPEIVIVGGFITGHTEPRQAALEIRKLFVNSSR